MKDLISILPQDAKAGENRSAGLRGGPTEGAEHAAGEGGRQSERRVEAAKRHPQVCSGIVSADCVIFSWCRKHVESGECKLGELCSSGPDPCSP